MTGKHTAAPEVGTNGASRGAATSRQKMSSSDTP